MSTTTAVKVVLSRRGPALLPLPPLLSAIAVAGGVVGVVVATDGSGAGLAAQIAGLALAAAVGYLLDDPATAVTQTVPRPLWRRRCATVVPGLGLLGAAWVLLIAVLHARAGGFPVLALTTETAVIAVLALAAAALVARGGEPEPGNIVAPAVALAGIAALLLEPSLGFPLFLSADTGPAGLVWCWAGVATGAALVLCLAWRDPARRRGA